MEKKSQGILCFPFLLFEKSRPHAYRKFVDLDAAGFCSDKMSEFMDEYQQAKYKDGVNYRHMVPPLYGLLDQFSHVFSSPHILFQYCFKIQVSLRLMGLHHLYQEILDVDKTDLSVEEQIH